MSVFTEAGKGGTGGWSDARLALIPEYKEKICELLRSGLFVSEIAQELNIGVRSIRLWRESDKQFDSDYSDAESHATDSLEKEAVRRAKSGVLEPVISAGKVVMDPDDPTKPLMIRKYSDSLMMFLLKGKRREVYGDKREVDAKVGIDVVGAKDSLANKFAAAAATAVAIDSGE